MPESREAFYERRKERIGCSEAAAALGLSPFCSPERVWFRFFHPEAARQEFDGNPYIEWGHRLESAILEKWTGEVLGRMPKDGEIQVPLEGTPEFLVGTADFYSEELRIGCDVKNVSAYSRQNWGEEYSGDIPIYYKVQGYLYMHLTGAKAWHFAALFGGNEWANYVLLPDERAMALIVEKLSAWYDRHIVHREMPSSGHPDSGEVVKALFPESKTGELVQADAETAKFLDCYRRAKAMVDATRNRLKAVEDHIKSLIGDNDGIAWDGGKITWKSCKGRTTTDWKRAFERLVAATETPEMIWQAIVEEQTKTSEGYRRFVTPRTWRNDDAAIEPPEGWPKLPRTAGGASIASCRDDEGRK